MTRGKQKIEAQRRNAEKNQKSKGSQLEARQVGLKVICPISSLPPGAMLLYTTESSDNSSEAQLANEKQLVDHYGSKHPKEKPPSNSS